MIDILKSKFSKTKDDLFNAMMPSSSDRERLWNILFDIDLVIWFVSLFFTLPSPWNIVYHVLSDGFFILWIARLVIIRNKYYRLKWHMEPTLNSHNKAEYESAHTGDFDTLLT